MRTIIVDDETLAVQYLTKVLADIGQTELIATYTSSLIAKDEIVAKKPDLVFLDIEMPKMNGLELASYLRGELPDVKIIFITSYEQYALQAIEIGNIEYILKPFEPELIAEKLAKIPQIIAEQEKQLPMICLLGELRFIYYEEGEYEEVTEVKNGKWRTKITREMFIYLMNSRGRYIRKDVLVETFWPELSVKEGYNILYATIHYMRNFLKKIDFPILIENKDDYYRLLLNGVLVDIDVWLKKTDALSDPMNKEFQNAVKLYNNHYLEEENHSWAEYNRQRYRIKWLEVMRATIDRLEAEKEYTQAILNALNFQHIEPYMEESYFILMKLFHATRDYKPVQQQYDRLLTMMQEEYNEKPNQEIIDWYRTWKNNDL